MVKGSFYTFITLCVSALYFIILGATWWPERDHTSIRLAIFKYLITMQIDMI